MKTGMRFDHVDGEFDTEEDELICVKSWKHQEVELCFKGNMHVPFARILLYGSGLFKDSSALFEDAAKLGDEICRRFNEAKDKK